MHNRDHPRVCGKYKKKDKMQCWMRGSPPRVREVWIRTSKCLLLARITPACAGSISRQYSPPAVSGDHPRMCGKYCFIKTFQVNGLGSPPRVREVFKQFTFYFKIIRITPACAGSIRISEHCRICERDHPRVCGKYKNSRYFFVRHSGSPPRVREVFARTHGTDWTTGITPACAGSI